jgi:4-hydroxythreonine-4-phosphate dehydrogenase
VAGVATRRQAHKIDSLLRGNWAHELVAVQQATGDRVLLVPALPRLGRVCRGGVVHVDGVPVGGDDARRAVTSARPADHLREAGGRDVVELAGVDDVAAWLAGGAAIGICDAETDDDLEAIATAWRAARGIRLAGTAGSIAAAAGSVGTAGSPAPPPVDGEVLVVCGSLHAMAREQLDALGEPPGVTVLRSPPPAGPAVDDAEAAEVARGLGAAARAVLGSRPVGVLVVIGGDTAAAVLGDEPLLVGGTLAPGVPWSRRADGSGPLVITKAGGFGRRDTLVDLLAGRRPSEER